jgi:hypothetical protein
MIFNFVSKLLYSIPLRFQFYRRLAFTRVFNFVQFNKINGDYVEFGVASGNTLKIAMVNAKIRGLTNMSFYGVDTFEGFPETNGPERDFITYSNIVGSRKFSRKFIQKKLRKFSMKLFLIKVNMEGEEKFESLKILSNSKIAIAHLDMDYYLPTLAALEAIKTNLSKGSVMLFDNYFFFSANSEMGEQRALNDFLAVHTEFKVKDYFTYSWHGKAFIVS